MRACAPVVAAVVPALVASALVPSAPRVAAALPCALLVCAAACLPARAAEPVTFPSATIDLGTCVTDIEASVRFYTEGIGFRELPGFGVPADLADAAGLTDRKPLSIRVLTLGEGPGATKLKLMQVAGTAPRGGDTDFVHSHTGFRYLTIMVNDTTAAVERLAKIGVKPIAKSPVALPADLVPPGDKFLTVVRDPDGNFVELIGPRK